jgi:hypothetical protein
MRVLEDLSESERYLYALLQDQSGVDIAEFLWVDERSPDFVYRCWDYQVAWYRSKDKFQIDQCARSIGKSEGIQMRAFAFAFTNPGEELLLTAPEMIHLDPTTERVEHRLLASRVTREMLKAGGTSKGIRHRPFVAEFLNGAKIVGRIPQKDGKGVKGMHPKKLEMDEAQDYPERGWAELGETLKFGNIDSTWRVHGVSKGVHDRYYKATEDPTWKVHRFTAMHRPDWTDGERTAKMEFYGGRNHSDYRRNILGLHGDLTNPLFVLHRLMLCVDTNMGSAYNTNEYQHIRLTDQGIRDKGLNIADHIAQLIDLPESHRSYERVWIGADIGLTNHPTEILIYGEDYAQKSKPTGGKRKNGQTVDGRDDPDMRLKLLARITLEQITAKDHRYVFGHLNEFYSPMAIAMDSTGLGLPIYQEIVEGDDRSLAGVIKGYNFSGKVIVGWNTTDDDHTFNPDDPEENAIHAPVLEYSTDMLRKVVDEKIYLMPYDRELIREFSGQTWVELKKATATNPYGKKQFSKGGFHALDGARMAILAWKQEQVEALLQAEDTEPVFDFFLV